MVMDLQDEGCNSADCAWREGQCVPGNADAADAVDADDNADAVNADDNADAHVDDDADEREGQIIQRSRSLKAATCRSGCLQ